MFNIVLHEPEIPHNAGAAGRLALATDSTLHLVKPLGFSLDDKQVRRTGLDYWQNVKLRVWENFEDLQAAADAAAHFWFLSSKASASPWQAHFRPGDYLVFGPETRGLAEELLSAAGGQSLRIPMAPGGTRSLNLSTAVAIVLYEAVRQQDPAW
jgi:tRNA (cytidine/uridine-2'-O-)-methyltransferase